MKLVEALTKLKNLKSKASRLDKKIVECMILFEDESTEYSYKGLLEERSSLQLEITNLKANIQLTNATTIVDFSPSEKKTLMFLILLNAQIRTELAFIHTQLNFTINEYTRSRDTIKRVFHPEYSKVDLESKLEELESSKEKLELLISKANGSTDLIEP